MRSVKRVFARVLFDHASQRRKGRTIFCLARLVTFDIAVRETFREVGVGVGLRASHFRHCLEILGTKPIDIRRELLRSHAKCGTLTGHALSELQYLLGGRVRVRLCSTVQLSYLLRR